jgi:hypothetical protein
VQAAHTLPLVLAALENLALSSIKWNIKFHILEIGGPPVWELPATRVDELAAVTENVRSSTMLAGGELGG